MHSISIAVLSNRNFMGSDLKRMYKMHSPTVTSHSSDITQAPSSDASEAAEAAEAIILLLGRINTHRIFASQPPYPRKPQTFEWNCSIAVMYSINIAVFSRSFVGSDVKNVCTRFILPQ
jgi:hypothetical protein